MTVQKALTRGSTDHFAAAVLYLEFPIPVSMLSHLVFPISLFHLQPKKEHFSPGCCDLELWPLIDEFGLHGVKMNHLAKYIRWTPFHSTVIVRTHKPSQPTWPVSPPIGCCHPHLPKITINYYYYYYSTQKLYSFYRPTKGGRLSRPRHCSKGVQRVPKAVVNFRAIKWT